MHLQALGWQLVHKQSKLLKICIVGNDHNQTHGQKLPKIMRLEYERGFINTLCSLVQLHYTGLVKLTSYKVFQFRPSIFPYLHAVSIQTIPIQCFKAHANGRNKCQQLPTMLGVVGQQCCVRLHGPKSLTGFKLYTTSANIVVVPCKRTQQVTTYWAQQCWVLLANNVGPVCMGLKTCLNGAL